VPRDVTPPRTSAFVVPDPRAEHWTTHSTALTQAGPRAGVPVPSQTNGLLSVDAYGVQTAAGSITLQTQKGGFPGLDAATFAWKNTSDTGSYFLRGWDPPQALQGWDTAEWTDGSGAVKSFADPCVVTLASGVVLCAAQVRDTGASLGEYGVHVLSRSTSNVWTRYEVYGQGTSPIAAGSDFKPCLVVLPSGRILLYFLLVSSSTGAAEASARMYYCDDGIGETWNYGGEVWPARIATAGATPTRMRGAYRDGQVLILVSYVNSSGSQKDRVNQYYSSDMGNTFLNTAWTPKDVAGALNAGGFFEVVATDLGFLVAYLAADVMISILLPDAFALLSAQTRVAGALTGDLVAGGGTGTSAISDGDLAMAVDDAGVVWVYSRIPATGECVVASSTDGGLTWSAVGSSVAYGSSGGFWHYGGTAADYPKNFAATFVRGKMLVVGNWVASTGDEDSSLGVWHLGGYSSVTMPAMARFPSPRRRAHWEIVWVPIELPGDMSWTTVGTGAASEALVTPGKLTASVVAGNTWYYRRVPAGAGTVAEGLIAQFAVTIAAGGDKTTNRISANFRVGAATMFGIDVRLAAGGFEVWDEFAGTRIGLSVTVSATAGLEILVGMGPDATTPANTACSVWYRVRTLYGSKKWLLGPSSAALTDGGAGANRVEFGFRAAGAATDTASWHNFSYATDYVVGQGIQNGNSDLIGRNWSSKPIYVDDGVSVSAGNGPTYIGDQWVVATRYDHEIRRALDIPSPRFSWRSTSTAANAIALKVRENAGEDGFGMSGILGIALFGANVAKFTLEGRDEDTASWVTIASGIDLCQGMRTLASTVTGSSVRPSSSTSATSAPYFRRNELAGCTFRVDANDSRIIRSNTEGRWTTGVGGIRPTIWLEAADGTETVTSVIATIIPKDVLVLVDLGGKAYSGFRLSIPAITGADGDAQPAVAYYEIGTLVLGWLMVVTPTDWGRSIDTVGNVERSKMRDGVTVAKKWAPPARTTSVSWMDGMDQTEIDSMGEADPDFIRVGSDTMASPAGTAYAVEGLLLETGGGERPIVYVEKVEPGIGVTVLNRRHQFMLCWPSDTVGRESAQGDPGHNEQARVASLDLEEEV
jgi:hypothetical protein